MKHVTFTLPGLFLLALCAATGCDRGPTSPSPADPISTFGFTVSPLDRTRVRSITRMVHRPNQTFPYLQITYSTPGDAVVAPAEAFVTGVSGAATSVRVDFTTISGVRFYLTNLASASAAVGARVAAGQIVGRVGAIDGLLPSVGFGVVNPALTQPFITPGRYPDEWLHADSAIRYLAEPDRSALMAAMQPPGLGEGKLCFDVPGTLQGFWYLEGVPASESTSDANRDARLWFYHNDLNPIERVVTYTGQGLTLTGSRSGVDDPDPAQVTLASGVVRFHFTRKVGAPPGWSDHDFVLLVEMLSPARLRAEAVDATAIPEPAFTTAARAYVR